MGLLKRVRYFLSDKYSDGSRGEGHKGPSHKAINKINVKGRKLRGRPRKIDKRDSKLTFRIGKTDKDKFYTACERLELKPGSVLDNFCRTFIARYLLAQTEKEKQKLRNKLMEIEDTG